MWLAGGELIDELVRFCITLSLLFSSPEELYFTLPFAAQEPETVGPDPLKENARVDPEPHVAYGVGEDGDERKNLK